MRSAFERAEAKLQRHFGYPSFRPAQAAIVRSVLNGHDTLAILPTGGGKSICYQVPAVVLDGLTIVVSPLISLMQDQVEAATRHGIAADHVAGELQGELVERILDRASSGELALLYVSPERLAGLAGRLRQRSCRIARLAVDEAHCVTEWGHDFRPAYRRISASTAVLGEPPVVALTGSATPEVRGDIIQSLGLGRIRRRIVHLSSFDRSNLSWRVIPVPNESVRLDRLAKLVRSEKGLVIVYASTRRQTESLALAIRHRGRPAVAYHAGLPAEVRARRLKQFLDGALQTIVATSAFGMGIDKPDVRLVAHWTMPATPESYYQEAGRAGRDGAPARCIMLFHPGDAELHRRQLDVTFPSAKLVRRVARGHRDRMADAVRASCERLLDEGAEGREAWQRIRARRRMAERRIAAMKAYAATRRCRRAQLLAWFGEAVRRCSGCDNCTAVSVPEQAVGRFSSGPIRVDGLRP